MRLTGMDGGPLLLGRRAQRQFVGGLVDHPTMLPSLILVGDEFPRSVGPCAHVGEVGRAVIVPAKLIPAHELYAYGFADRLRHHRRGLRGIVIAAATERARALIELDPGLF